MLKLIAPFTPHISEAVFQNFFRATEPEKSIHKTTYTSYPVDDFIGRKEGIREGGELLFRFIEAMRKDKTVKSIRLGETTPSIEITGTERELAVLREFVDDIRSVSHVGEAKFVLGEKLSVSSFR